ncbi:USP domain-containing protein [Aphelenchoides besseyi]|nr:USP domain-containing protein [Aphelenchoides besseyi]KAI6219626.1 USP domain-containing protein [Aphelenchoides besseyi]
MGQFQSSDLLQNPIAPLMNNAKEEVEKPIKRRGFDNLGKTCYLSSVVVALSSIPKIVSTLDKYNQWLDEHSDIELKEKQVNKLKFVQELSRLLVSFRDNRTAPSARLLHALTGQLDSNFKGHVPQDAHEFLSLITEAAETFADVQDKIDGRDKTNRLFFEFPMFFTMRSRVECSICKKFADSKEEAVGVSIEANNHNPDWWILDTWYDEELMVDTNRFQCDKCQKKVDAARRTSPLTLPDCLVIHYKLFEAVVNNGRLQLVKYFPVVFPPRRIYACDIPVGNRKGPKDHIYRLKALIIHMGVALDDGHYICAVRVGQDKWCVYNDEMVSYANWESLMHMEKAFTPYLMFYEKHTVKSSTDSNSNATI